MHLTLCLRASILSVLGWSSAIAISYLPEVCRTLSQSAGILDSCFYLGNLSTGSKWNCSDDLERSLTPGNSYRRENRVKLRPFLMVLTPYMFSWVYNSYSPSSLFIWEHWLFRLQSSNSIFLQPRKNLGKKCIKNVFTFFNSIPKKLR